jgi:hypothetical protein
MEDYYFIFRSFAYINSVLLAIYGILSLIVIYKSNSKILKLVALYLLCSSFFDLTVLLFKDVFARSLIPLITYRTSELLIIGYLINRYWLKSKIAWVLICCSFFYLIYDLLTYQSRGMLNYEANAQTAAIVLLIGLIVTNLLKQLNSSKEYNFTNQMLSMVFLAYFSINLIYTVIQNFIINQSFTNKSFAIFYSSYALLHIIYYFALAFILYKNRNKAVIFN